MGLASSPTWRKSDASIRFTLRLLVRWSPQPGWRNWQTRRPQKPLLERVCGFESHSGHCYLVLMTDAVTPTFRDDIVALFPGQGSLGGGAGVAWRDSRHWSLVDRVSDIASVN